MKPVEILKNEHRVIEVVLNCLESMAEKALRDGKLEAEPARQAVDFFRNFADRCHHGKEEAHLFTWMEAHGFPRQGGPTGVMLHEHEEGRSHVRGMDAAIERAAQGEAVALRSFVKHAQSFIPLLREHIQKEDHCLFSMADQSMSEDDRVAMLQAFEHTEREDIGHGVHEKYLEIARSLAARYQVDAHEVDANGIPCGCHH